jgi:WD40 repeat protein
VSRPRPESPYKGLNAFEDSELDALLFFGRERETEIVVANLIASRLTVLYGPSGVGKSSLLRAAVARSLRALPEEPLVVVFSRWSEDPAAALTDAVGEALGSATRNGSPLAALEDAQRGRDVYLVLDQAEEYFLYHADDAGAGSFAEALPALLAAPFRVNVLVSLREDSLAKLDRFTGRIPGLFANTLRLDRLDREAARAAIVRPVERYAQLTGETVTIEPQLVERVLDEVGTGAIEPALGGLGAVEGAEDGARIEAPYLQVVMQRLWDDERAEGSDVLRVETLERLGGAQRIVEEHLEGALAELSPPQKDVAARLFNHLVTPSGTKIAHELSDLADFGRVPVAELQPVLATLGERRILRSLEEGGGVRYEIFHDVLAQPVLAWRTAHVADRELRRQQDESDRRHRRLLAVIAVGSVLLAVMAATTVYALSQRSEARDQAREATAHQLEALSAADLAIDPERSLLFAREAARLAPTATAEEALRSALLFSRVRTVVDVGEPLLGATVQDGNVLTATDSGSLVVADGTTGEVLSTIETGAPARRVSFAEDGTALVTARDGSVRVVRADGAVEEIPGAAGVERAGISPDASLAVLVDAAGGRLVDVETGEVERSFPHRGAVSAAISRDNRRIATGAADGTIRVWARTGAPLRTLVQQEGRPSALAFGTAGASVVSAGTDGLARIWQTGTGQPTAVLEGDATGLTDVGFSTDGRQIVTASEDGTVRVSNPEQGVTLVVLNGHRERVTSASFTGPVGSSVVTASRDGTARTWDALFQPELEELASFPAAVSVLEAEGGRLRVTTADGRLHVLDAETGEEIAVEAGRERERVASGPDGATARIRFNTVVLRADGTRTNLDGHRDRVRSVEFSPDGSLLATASRDQDVRIWDGRTGEPLVALTHNSEVRDASFSPDGRWVVSAAFRASLWDPRSGLNVVRLQGHEGPVTAATFDSSGKTIVTGGVDGTVRRYECVICGELDELLVLADERLAATGRELTEEERERYLG